MTVKILAFDGSGRAGSLNHNAVLPVVKLLRALGAEVTELSLHDLQLPLYDQADEIAHGLPESAKTLKKLFREHDAFLIGSPEHNGSMTAQLKNAIDWASRKESPQEAANGDFVGKIAGLVAASPGKLGGLRGLYQLNTVLFGMGVTVLPEILSIGFAKDAFDADGNLKNDPDKAAAEKLAKRLIKMAQAAK